MPNPAEAVTLSSELLKILPVAIGGLLAVSGGMLSQFLTFRLNANRDKARIKREKLEALVQALYEHSDWLRDMRHNWVYSTEFRQEPSPLEKAWMLQQLYFPQLKKSIQALSDAALPLVLHCIEQRQAQIRDQSAWINDNDGYNKLYEPCRKVFLKTVQEASQLASKYSEV